VQGPAGASLGGPRTCLLARAVRVDVHEGAHDVVDLADPRQGLLHQLDRVGPAGPDGGGDCPGRGGDCLVLHAVIVACATG
jgi:hypothetical protein